MLRTLYLLLLQFNLVMLPDHAISQNLVLQLTASNYNGYNISCFGGTNGAINLTVYNGVAPYTFIWTNEATTEDISNLSEGYYKVVVRDYNGLTAEAQITLTEPEPFEGRVELWKYTHLNGYNTSCTFCNDGVITTSVEGGIQPYSFQWTDGAITQDRSGIGSGEYQVIVSDANGCTVSEGTNISAPARDDWTMSGNTGTTSNNFIGTNDNKDLVIKTDNMERLRITSDGELKIPLLGGSQNKLLFTDINGNLSGVNVSKPTPTGGLCDASLYTYFPLAWQTGSNPSELFNCWQRFGIGTSTPQDALDVKGTLRLTAWNSVANAENLRLQHDGTNARIDNFGLGNLLINYGDGFNIGEKDVLICTGNSGDVTLGGNNYLAPDVGKNVGIGTSTPDPLYKLDVNGLINSTGFVKNGSVLGEWIVSGNDMFNSNSGNISIGTSLIDPYSKLNIASGNNSIKCHLGTGMYPNESIIWAVNSSYAYGFGANAGIGYIYGDITLQNRIVTFTQEGKVGIGYNVYPDAMLDVEFIHTSAGNDIPGLRVFVDHSGPDGYGIISETLRDDTKAISVQSSEWLNNKENFIVYGSGAVRARSIKVTAINPFPDYVFETDYELLSLNDLEMFILKNKHLPEIPTANEINDNGIDIEEQLILQVKKIEELTLYVINLNKEIEKLKSIQGK